MMLKDALLAARSKGTPCLITRDGSDYEIEPLDHDAAFVYMGGDTLPIPVNGKEAGNLSSMLGDLFLGKLTKVVGAKIKRRV